MAHGLFCKCKKCDPLGHLLRGGTASTRSMIVGNGSNGGYRYTTSGGSSITSGPAKDKRYPGGSYTSVSRPDGGKKSITYDAYGNIVQNRPNSKW